MEVKLSPITDQELNLFLPESIDMYAQSMVDNGEYPDRKTPDHLAENEVYSYFPNGLLRPNEHIFSIIDQDNEETIIGTTWMSIHPRPKFSTAFLVWIDIRPDYRRQGLAKKTLKQLETYVRRFNVAHIDLSVFANNHGARKLYQEMGYHEVRTKMLGQATQPSRHELRKHLLAVFAMAG